MPKTKKSKQKRKLTAKQLAAVRKNVKIAQRARSRKAAERRMEKEKRMRTIQDMKVIRREFAERVGERVLRLLGV